MLLLILLLFVLFGLGGPYYGYQQWGYAGGGGILVFVLILFLLFWVFGRGRFL